MAKQRFIKTNFWSDRWILSLEKNQRYLYIYLLTNDKTNLCGIYQQPFEYIVLETGLLKQEIIEIFEFFQEQKKVVYKDGWIIMLNHKKHQTKSPKIAKGVERELLEIPEYIARIAYPIDTVEIDDSLPKSKSLVQVPVKVPVKFKKVKVAKVEKIFEKESEEYKKSELLFDSIKKNQPIHSFHKFSEGEREEQIQTYSRIVDLILRIDQREIDHVDFLIKWCQQNNFWKANILGMENFRDKFDKLAAQAQFFWEKDKEEKKKKEQISNKNKII